MDSIPLKALSLSMLILLQASTLFCMERAIEQAPAAPVLSALEVEEIAQWAQQNELWSSALKKTATELDECIKNPQMSKTLIQKNAQELLYYACCLQDIVHARIAFDHDAQINFRYPSSAYQTPLAVVMGIFNPLQKKSEEFLRLLLETPRLDITVCDQDRWCAFTAGCFNEKAVNALKILIGYKDKLKPKLDLNALRGNHSSALHIACERGNVDLVNLLCLQPEINPNIQDGNFKRTPLHDMVLNAFSPKSFTIARILVNKGASFECVDSEGATVIDATPPPTNHWGRNHEYYALSLGAHLNPEQLKTLGVLPPDPYTTEYNYYQKSLISMCYFWAIKGVSGAGQSIGFDLLAQCAKKIDLNVMDGLGLTPFMWAAARGRLDLAKALYAYKQVNVNMADSFGDTALHYAARGGHAAMIQFLLSLPETDTSIKNCMGLKAFDVAKNCQQWAPTNPNRHDEIINLFQKIYRKRALFAIKICGNFTVHDEVLGTRPLAPEIAYKIAQYLPLDSEQKQIEGFL